MNTFWLKIAGVAVGVIVIIVLIGQFTSSNAPKPAESVEGFYDQVEKDKKKFLTEPQALEPQKQEPPLEQNQEPDNKNETVAEPVQPVREPPKPAEPTKLYFKELSEIEKVEAEKYLNVAVPARSIGRLPTTGFGLMVDNCRRIIQRWPDSWYAYRAQQMLIDMPERYRIRYKVTKEEMDLSRFAKPRPGIKPFVIKESP
jgi:hypothetical protein